MVCQPSEVWLGTLLIAHYNKRLDIRLSVVKFVKNM